MEKVFSTKWLDRDLIFKTGKLANQADASVLVQYGETVVLATAVQSKQARQGIDFFPLMVDVEEKLYAAGIIKGSRWIKREGRPSDQTILTTRMIDRAIRPLFDHEDRRDVQVILTLLAADQENDHDIVSLIAASAVLSMSGIDWKGPIGGIRVGLDNDNNFIFNPTYKEQENSKLDLIVAGDSKKVIMLEGSCDQIPEKQINEAIEVGQENMQAAIDLINKIKNELGKEKKPIFTPIKSEEEKKEDEEKEKLLEIGERWLKENISKTLFDTNNYSKNERKAAVRIIKEELDKYLFSLGHSQEKRAFVIKKLVDKMVEAEVTNAILEDKKRVDGRSLTDIRSLSSEVGLFDRTHGSSLFSRGETQLLSIVTLGSAGLEQSLEGVEGQSKKSFMHHYNFPPFSVGETSPLRGAGRREVGHGALAEKALTAVMPDKEKFPYTVRVVSETLGSNGSSSMGATCASSLALMDAGVPIKKAVAGIAMGLSSNKDMSKWEVLTDIQDLEDGEGGADFKIAGTDSGLTAIQLDTKTLGLNKEITKKVLTQGREALNNVLENMNKAIDKPKESLSQYAPKIISFSVDPEKIGAIIGPGGKIINKIIEETGVDIDIEDEGLVMVCGTEEEKLNQAVNRIKEIVRVFEAGEIIHGKVVRLMDFGAFVELNANQDGLVHVSEMAPYHVSQPGDILNVGDMVTVKIKEIDDQGRVNLTMKNLEENKKFWQDNKGKSDPNKRNDFNNKQRRR